MAESVDTSRRPRSLHIEALGPQGESSKKHAGAVTPIKKGNLRVDQYGETSYKKTPSDRLRQSIQLGLQVSIASLEPKPKRDLLMTDFEVVESNNFPEEGSESTPAHKFPDFKFNTYSPVAFRFFREAFEIKPDDYMLGVCDKALIELSNPGASGSLFYVSSNDEFIIKTVQKKETEFLQKLLPGYYLNLTQNKYTLLPKFFGLYKYQSGGTNIRIVVMNNLLPRSHVIHEKYDLKGSTYKRRASEKEREKKCPTFKDLDFQQMHQEGFTLSAEHYETVERTINKDVKVLESFGIMDYSLLLGVHYLDSQKDLEKSIDTSVVAEQLPSRGPSNVIQEPSAAAQVPGGAEQGKVRRFTYSILYRKSDTVPRRPFVSRRQEVQEEEEQQELQNEGGIPARTSDGKRVLLFVGIIDILQSYRLKKKLEHTFKSIYADKATVSVCNPHFYAQRFSQFMLGQVFKKGKAKSRVRKGSVSRRRPTTGADSSPVVATNERREFPTANRESNSVLPSYLEVVQRDQREKEKISSEELPKLTSAGDDSEEGLISTDDIEVSVTSVQLSTQQGQESERQPQTEDQPRVGDGHPRVADDQPQVGDGHPRVGDDQPQVGDGHPQVGDGQPRVGDGQPRVGDDQPQEQVTISESQPGGETPQPKGENPIMDLETEDQKPLDNQKQVHEEVAILPSISVD